jgi:LPXTG-motif cell wall-anchored protein
LTLLSLSAAAQQKMPQTTKERIAGTPAVQTQQLRGTVSYVEGNTLVVRMSSGDLRQFQVPESRRFIIDGRELTVHDLQPGTRLQATVTTTTTPITERTTTIGSGRVFYVAAPNVIVTLPNGENRMYKVDKNYHFNVEGKSATVFELRKGMNISAEKIVEEPTTELATNITVTGQAPAKPAMARAPTSQELTPSRAPSAPAAPAAPVERASAAPPASQSAAEAPAKLPKTGSPLPLIGVLGLVLIAGSFGLRKLRGL